MADGDEARARTADEVFVVVNPVSGRGRAKRWAEMALERLAHDGRRAHLVRDLDRFEPPGDGTSPREWWLFGGDGTLNGVLQRVRDAQTRIAIFPTGTGNVVARELGVPLEFEGALRIASGGVGAALRPFDLGRVNGQRFAFMVSAGIDAELVQWVALHRRGPMRRTDWLFAARGCRRSTEPQFEVALDDSPPVPARYVAIFNCGLYAGGFRVCPAARCDDGFFHVLTLREPVVPRFMRVAWAFWRGRPDRLPDAALRTARRVRVVGAARSQVDGDPGPEGALDVALEPGAVLMRGAPPSTPEQHVLA